MAIYLKWAFWIGIFSIILLLLVLCALVGQEIRDSHEYQTRLEEKRRK